MKFSLINVDRSSLERSASLLQQVFPKAKKFSGDYLQWLYHDNPYGKVVGFEAWDRDVLAAHYATIPTIMKDEARSYRCLLSLNTAVSESHRGQGLFLKLASQTYQRAKEEGFDFVFGIANAHSTPGFIKLGFELVTPLKVRWGIGRFWKGPPVHKLVQTQYTNSYLDWRFRSYQGPYHLLQEGESMGKRLIVRELDHNMPAVVMGGVSEGFMDRFELPEVQRRHLLYIGYEPDLSFLKLKSLTIPKRLKPSPLNLIYKPLNPELPMDLGKRLKIQAADFDAY